MKYCGLDVSNKSIAICVVDQTGKIEFEGSALTQASDLKHALKGFNELQCVVEATALAETICDWIEAIGHKIEILDTRQAKAITATKKKTDRIDAQKLAQLCRTGWYTRVHRKSGTARCLRSYLTARVQVVKAATAMFSTVRGLLRAHGIIVAGGDGKKFEQSVRAALTEAEPMLRDAVEPLLAMWRLLHDQEQSMYKNINRKIARKNPDILRLMSVPGVGPATAAAFVATIDDPRRFPKAEQVASYLGLVPALYQSGDIELKGSITKHGDDLLRWLLVEASATLLSRSQQQCALKTWGLKLQAAKGFGKARVAVARKLACLLHHLWISKQTFDAKAAA